MKEQAVLPEPSARVWGCVVCYQATAAEVEALLSALRPQVERLILLDNSPCPESGLQELADGYTIYHPLDRNLGTAGAMNRGWELATAAGAQFLLAFDQDSRPAPNLVRALLAAWTQAQRRGGRVAAVGPLWHDARTGRPMRVLLPVRWRRCHAVVAGDPVAADHLITSGCLISVAAFREIGPFDEQLFLDYVDVEWCLRARALGFSVYVAPGGDMRHAIGDTVLRIGKRSVSVHSPLRNYLVVRNHFLLWRRPAAPLGWLLSDLRQLVGKMCIALAAAPARFTRLSRIGQGLRDGLRGRGGPPPAF